MSLMPGMRFASRQVVPVCQKGAVPLALHLYIRPIHPIKKGAKGSLQTVKYVSVKGVYA
jgi:hypothetical protein